MFSKIIQIFKAFSKKERNVFIASFLIFFAAFILGFIKIIEANTILRPVNNGQYIEGVVGQPVFINPVLSDRNSPDSDLSRFLFADLKTLIETYSASDDHRVFNIRLKEGLVWDDNQPLTVDDVVFTIKAIQDPDVDSPLYSNWKGVKIERSSELEMKITLPHPYSFFENTFLDLRPIPKHIFGSVPFANLKLSSYNLEPISSGPFKFYKIEKRKDGFITEYDMTRNEKYSGDRSYLDEFIFRFYSNEDELVRNFNFGQINGFALSDSKKIPAIRVPRIVREISMPRYYALFFNSSNNYLLKDINLRVALNHATDKNKITQSAFSGAATVIDNPVIFNNGYDAASDFSIEKANDILNVSGWTINNEGIRKITALLSSKKLEFGLTVYPVPFLIETAKIIKDDWQKIGVKVNLNIPAPNDFENDIIKTRNYEMLLFGNIYGKNLDPFSFWHSSQKFHPGLNFSVYENKSADYIIELARTEFNQERRNEDMQKLAALIKSDQPAIFLYSPKYLYISSKNLGGFDPKNLPLPSDRFAEVSKWYVKTARVLK